MRPMHHLDLPYGLRSLGRGIFDPANIDLKALSTVGCYDVWGLHILPAVAMARSPEVEAAPRLDKALRHDRKRKKRPSALLRLRLRGAVPLTLRTCSGPLSKWWVLPVLASSKRGAVPSFLTGGTIVHDHWKL
jgi:hypothetical protein